MTSRRTPSLSSGEPVRGTWFDRTAEHRDKLRGEEFEPRRHATEETVELSQLPCWRHLSPEMYRKLVAGLIEEIEADAAAERKRTGREPLGAAAILRQHPHTCPSKSKKSPALIGVHGAALIKGFRSWTTPGRERCVRKLSKSAGQAAKGLLEVASTQ